MGLIKAAWGLRMSDEQWRQLECRYGGCEGPTEQQDGRIRRWGEYKQTMDQRVAPSLDPELREEVNRRGGSMTINEFWDNRETKEAEWEHE